MTLRRMLLGLAALSVTVLPLTADPASAQAKYPSKSVHWIVGYVPGGTTDILARLIGHSSGRPGSSSSRTRPARQQPRGGSRAGGSADGTSAAGNPANGINATLYKAVVQLRQGHRAGRRPMRVPNVMVVNNDVPAKTVKEFIDHVKANPGKVNMASSGNGLGAHVRRIVHGDDWREDDSCRIAARTRRSPTSWAGRFRCCSTTCRRRSS